MRTEINITDNFKEFDLLKGGKKTGTYTDTAENRKLGRVGQKYTVDIQEKPFFKPSKKDIYDLIKNKKAGEVDVALLSEESGYSVHELQDIWIEGKGADNRRESKKAAKKLNKTSFRSKYSKMREAAGGKKLHQLTEKEWNEMNENLGKSLTFADGLDESMNGLKKSHIHYAFNNKEIIERQGRDLVPAIEGQELKELLCASKHKEKASLLHSEIGEEPSEELDEYSYHNTKTYFSDKPKVYKIEHDGVGQIDVTAGSMKDSEDPKERFNNCIREFVDAASEAIKLGILKRNIKPEKVYRLTLDQAAALGL
jgi:hypothetical protein